MTRILIVDDDPDIRTILADRLRANGHDVLEANDGLQALELTARERPDLLLLDLDLPGIDGLTVLERLPDGHADPTVIVITAFGSIEKAVEAMRRGAYDFIPKPFTPAHIEVVVRKAIERSTLREENRALRASLGEVDRQFLGSSPAAQKLLETARKVAASRSTVLLLGESGTGKEILARCIHNWSPRASRPFVAVNCCALPEELLESELFGHEKGSFTGAHQQKLGKFEIANRSTIFLDEIGDIRESAQTKLLRVLQEHEIERVGGTKPTRVDIRVIAATNCDLEAHVAEGRFREDLFYRLNVIALRLPPLRERLEDIPALANHFLRRFTSEMGKPFERIAPEALDTLKRHSWPGNVRELENTIERAVVLGSGSELNTADLALLKSQETSSPRLGIDSEPGPFHARVEEFKRDLIRQTLESCDGNQTRAAKQLDLQRTYLARLIKNLSVRN